MLNIHRNKLIIKLLPTKKGSTPKEHFPYIYFLLFLD